MWFIFTLKANIIRLQNAAPCSGMHGMVEGVKIGGAVHVYQSAFLGGGSIATTSTIFGDYAVVYCVTMKVSVLLS